MNVANTAKQVVEGMEAPFRTHASVMAQEITPLVQNIVRYVNPTANTLTS